MNFIPAKEFPANLVPYDESKGETVARFIVAELGYHLARHYPYLPIGLVKAPGLSSISFTLARLLRNQEDKIYVIDYGQGGPKFTKIEWFNNNPKITLEFVPKKASNPNQPKYNEWLYNFHDMTVTAQDVHDDLKRLIEKNVNESWENFVNQTSYVFITGKSRESWMNAVQHNDLKEIERLDQRAKKVFGNLKPWKKDQPLYFPQYLEGALEMVTMRYVYKVLGFQEPIACLGIGRGSIQFSIWDTECSTDNWETCVKVIEIQCGMGTASALKTCGVKLYQSILEHPLWLKLMNGKFNDSNHLPFIALKSGALLQKDQLMEMCFPPRNRIKEKLQISLLVNIILIIFIIMRDSFQL